MKRFIKWLAKQNGLLVIPKDRVITWTLEARERNQLATQYDLADEEYMAGLNDGRCEVAVSIAEELCAYNGLDKN